MKVGFIGTGAIAHKHAQACLNIGVQISACCSRDGIKGQAFADQYGCEFEADYEKLCERPDVDYVDVCTYPDFRLSAVEACARAFKPIHIQKPMATSLRDAARMIEVAAGAGILLGVTGQQRFTDGAIFLKDAIAKGRLGRLIQADAYVKWYRIPEYYERTGKGSWALEGGGALMNQGIHQVDLLSHLVGDMAEVFGYWQLGTIHRIESEDVLSGVVRYDQGATGVIQASTALWPGASEKLEFHGTKGSATLTAGRLTAWSTQEYEAEAPQLQQEVPSGASDPTTIELVPFEREAMNFVSAIQHGTRLLVDGEAGYKTLRAVMAFYRSCQTGRPVRPAEISAAG